MDKNYSKYIGAGVIALASIVTLVAQASQVNAATTSTTINATVGKNISCSGTNPSISTITPGQAGTGTFTISGTTNSVSGFKITAGTVGNLTSGSNTISSNASAAAGTQGWKMVPTTSSEWSGLSSSTITTSSAWTNSSTSDTETITVTVGTTSSTPSGTYSGTIEWTCAAV